jgi:hypothetical protein
MVGVLIAYPPGGVSLCKPFIFSCLQKRVLLKYSFQKGYGQNIPNKGVTWNPSLQCKSPGDSGAFACSCIQYSGWSITHTPRECAGLARVFVSSGLDKIFPGKSKGGVSLQSGVRPVLLALC